MRQPAKWSSRQGFLLLEAILSAVVIAVGLVFISRALGSQLRAVGQVESYDVLLQLAHNKLQELEAERLSGLTPDTEPQQGKFSAPDETVSAYEWNISASHIAPETIDPDGKLQLAEVRVRVRSGKDASARSLTLRELWPKDWVPPGWYQ